MNYSIPFVGNIKLRLISLMRFQKIIKDPKINKFINKRFDKENKIFKYS